MNFMVDGRVQDPWKNKTINIAYSKQKKQCTPYKLPKRPLSRHIYRQQYRRSHYFFSKFHNPQVDTGKISFCNRFLLANVESKTVKTIYNKNLIMEVTKKKHAELLLKWPPPHEKWIKKSLHIHGDPSTYLERVMKSPELSACSIKEVKLSLQKKYLM